MRSIIVGTLASALAFAGGVPAASAFSGQVVSSLSTQAGPVGAVTYGSAQLYVANEQARTLQMFQEWDNQLLNTVSVVGEPRAMAQVIVYTLRRIAVVSANPPTVSFYDLRDLALDDTTALPPGADPSGIYYDWERSRWVVGDRGTNSVLLSDGVMSFAGSVSVGGAPVDIAFGGEDNPGRYFVLTDNALVTVDGATDTVVHAVALPEPGTSVTWSPEGPWVSTTTGHLIRFSQEADTVLGVVDIGGSLASLEDFGGPGLLVADEGQSQIVVFDPIAERVVHRVSLPTAPSAIVKEYWAESIYVVSKSGNAVYKLSLHATVKPGKPRMFSATCVNVRDSNGYVRTRVSYRYRPPSSTGDGRLVGYKVSKRLQGKYWPHGGIRTPELSGEFTMPTVSKGANIYLRVRAINYAGAGRSAQTTCTVT